MTDYFRYARKAALKNDAICDSKIMKNSRPIFLRFLIAGLVSGVGSGLSAALPPSGVFLPGLFFGISISHAVHRSLTALTVAERLVLVAASTVAWFVALVTALLSSRITGRDNGYLGGVVTGALGGGVGAFLVALALILVVSQLRPISSLATITVVGAILGSVFVTVGIYISNHPALGHPFDDFVTFPIWQAGVASFIPLSRDQFEADAFQ